MSDVVKSIFRQREVEKLYELCLDHWGNLHPYIHQVCIDVRQNTNIISDKEIGRYDVEIPMLDIGDSFFLHDIQEVVIIEDRMRSSDGSITYYVKDKLVETENTKRTREECNKQMTEYSEIRKKFKAYAAKYKYEHRFFNRECAEEICI